MMRLVFLIIVPIAVLLRYMIGMPNESYRGALAPVTGAQRIVAKQLLDHVRKVAGTEHNTRHPEALEAAASYIETQLAGMGYQFERQIVECDAGKVRNIEVQITGDTQQAEIIVVGAHYDSAYGAPGANDNGSGTAMLLELARSFKSRPARKTLRFVFFVNEEPPYFGAAGMGSLAYANRSRARNENISAMLSLETIGYYDDDAGSQKYPVVFRPFFPSSGNFVAFIGDLESRALVQRTVSRFRTAAQFPSEGIATFSWIKGINWSDHYAFWKNGYRAIMITDTAVFRYPQYHTRQDTADKLDYEKMARVFSGIDGVVADLAGASSPM